ncbi:MAG: dienelactone hydrolase family protein [Pirellulales bacterium]
MNGLPSWSRRQWLQCSSRLTASVILAARFPECMGRSCAHADDAPRRNVPWLAEVQQPPAPPIAANPRVTPLLLDAAGQPIATADAWQTRRRQLLERWAKILGLEHVPRPSRPKVVELGMERVGDVERRLIRYETHAGWTADAYLLRPAAGSPLDRGSLPAAIALHSTVDHTIRQPGGLEGPPEKFFGLKLAQRGFACICPRNYLWPEISGRIAAQGEAERFLKQFPGATGMAKMLHDAQIALDILLAEPRVDAQSVTAVGHSLGAKEVLHLAAFDERVTCTVSSEGGVGVKFSNWDAPWYLGAQVRDPSFTADHHELLGVIAPRPFLLVGGNSADGDASWPFIDAALPVYRLLDKHAPRIGLLNHKQGHAIPPAVEPRLYEWIERYGRS